MLKLHETLKEAFPGNFVQVDKHNSATNDGFIKVSDGEITFKLQEGPVKETGLNGVQTIEMLQFVGHYLRILDNTYPCEFNKQSIEAIDEAIDAQIKRTIDRKARNVEGRSIP